MNSNIMYVNEEEILKEKLEDIECFKTVDLSYPLKNYNIEKILCVKADVFIGETELLKTSNIMSNDGIYLSGYKLRVELIINHFIKYLDGVSIRVIRNRNVKIVNIVVPKEKNNINIEELFRKKRIKINTHIEDIYCDKFEDDIEVNISLLVNCTFI